MSLIVADNGGSDFKRVPAGVHIGRCCRLIDLGTQEETYEGETKLLPKLSITWELFGEDEEGNPLVQDDGKPMLIWQEFTASLGKKAKLRAALESWRGRAFTDEDLKGFDVSKLLGAYCMVNVTEKKAKTSDKTYMVVSSLTPLPAALKASKPEGVWPNLVFDLSKPDEDVFAQLHEKVQERIGKSLERSGYSPAEKAPSKGHADQSIPDDDDVPF